MNSPSKILILADGNSVHTKKWLMILVRNGFDVSLFSLQQVLPQNTLTGVKIIPSFSIKPNDTSLLKLIKIGIKFFALKKISKKLQFDLVHAHYATSYGFIGCLLKPAKLAVSFWGSDIFDFPNKTIIHKLFIKYILRNAHFILSTSKIMRLEILKYTNKKVIVTPFGVNINNFKPTIGIPKENIVIGTIKSLYNVYGIDRLIKAFSIVYSKHSNTRLHIYGNGPELNSLNKLTQKLGISNVVEFKGFVSGARLVDSFHNIDIFVALSRQESFGVAVIEASACGLPVIVSNAGGLPEVVVQNKTGFIIENGNFYLAAEKIELLIKNATLRNKIGEAGRAFVETNYSEVISEKIIIDFYSEVFKIKI